MQISLLPLNVRPAHARSRELSLSAARETRTFRPIRCSISSRSALWALLSWNCWAAASLTGAVTRHIRSLGFPESSGMGIFFAIAIPIDIPDKSISLSWYFEANYGMPTINSSVLVDGYFRKRSILDRRLLYDVIQTRLESEGYPGRACLLRTICESSRFPFGRNGLVGDIIRIIFTPSSSLKEDLPADLERAERAQDCSPFEEACPSSLLDLISPSLE